MKQLFAFTLTLLLSQQGLAQTDITRGSWYNEEKDSKIQFFGQGDKLQGKIVWLEQNPAILDTKNPDPQQQKRKLLGAVVLTGFKPNGANSWSTSSAYDPKSGKTYNAKLTLINANTLEVRGYIGSPLFGRTTKFTRAD